MTTIIVTDKIRLEFTKHQSSNIGTYSPVVFVEGGKEARNPRTGETLITEDKWVKRELYFSNLIHALRWCAQEAVEMGSIEEVKLGDYISKLEAVWKK